MAHRIVGVVACGTVVFGVAASGFAAAEGVTRPTVLVEEFTAEWCGPCYGGFYAMERMKARWGDQVSLLCWSIADRYTHGDATRRQNEVGVSAIPSFLFHGTYFSVGTPPDQTIDSYVTQSQNLPKAGQIIGRWKLKPNSVVGVGLKFQADQNLSNYELRVHIHESNWYVQCSNGLTHYNNRVQAVYYEALPTMSAGEQFTLIRNYDLSDNPWIHDMEEVGVTVFLHDRGNGRSVRAAWELGAVSLGDLNGDLSITQQDVALFQAQMGKRIGQPGFNHAADFDQNGIINLVDRDLALEYIRNGGMR